MKITRSYNYSSIDTLTASKIVSQSFNLYISELSMVRTNWTEEYATNLAVKIEAVVEKYLGLDKQKELRDATESLIAIQLPAIEDLSFVKKQIEVDYGKEASKILKALGFNKHWQSAQKKDQESLIELLYSFKKGLSDKLRTTITAKGLNGALLDKIISYADQMMQKNVSQESFKETTKSLSEDAVKAINGIYEEIIGICKIASSFYKNDPLKKEQFTFAKVIKNMNSAKKIDE